MFSKLGWHLPMVSASADVQNLPIGGTLLAAKGVFIRRWFLVWRKIEEPGNLKIADIIFTRLKDNVDTEFFPMPIHTD